MTYDDMGLKRRKGESHNACIERLLKLIRNNGIYHTRQSQRVRDLEARIKELEKNG